MRYCSSIDECFASAGKHAKGCSGITNGWVNKQEHGIASVVGQGEIRVYKTTLLNWAFVKTPEEKLEGI